MKKYKLNVSEFVFLIAIFLIQFSAYTKNIKFLMNYSDLLINFSIIVLLVHVVVTVFTIKMSKKKWLACIVALLISLFSYFITKDSLLLQFTLVFIGAFNIDFKKAIKKDLAFKFLLFIFILFCYYQGYTAINEFVRDGEFRYALGFIHPNTLGYFLLSLYFEIIYLFHKKINLLSFILLSVLMELILNIPKSRAAQLAIVLFIIISLIYYISKKVKIKNNGNVKNYSFALRNLFLFLLIVSFVLTTLYSNGNNIAIQLDDLFSSRLYLQSLYLDEYGISLFGNYINYFSIIDNYFATLDNVYFRLIMNFGIIGFLLVFWVFNKTIYNTIKNNEVLLTIIFITLLFYGMMEYSIIKPGLNIFLIYFPCLFNSKSLE